MCPVHNVPPDGDNRLSGTPHRDLTATLVLPSGLQLGPPVSWGTTACRYNWHSAGSPGWPFPTLKYKYIFQIKHTEAILSNNTRKLLRFEVTRILVAVSKNNFIALFIVIFGTFRSLFRSFHISVMPSMNESVQLPSYADNASLPAFSRRCCSSRAISPTRRAHSSKPAARCTAAGE